MIRDFSTKQSPLRGMSGYGGGASATSLQYPPGVYTSGQYYPIMAMKSEDDSGATAVPSPNCDIPFRRMLTFDINNTSTFGIDDSFNSILTKCDSFKYTVNPEMKTRVLSGLKVEHWQSSGTTMYNDAEVLFNGTTFNVYDHMCNVQSNLSLGRPSELGSVTLMRINSSTYSDSGRVFINTSTSDARDGNNGWASDNGDYCFFGLSDKDNSGIGQDDLDKQFATSEGIAFGISDSDGTPSSGQVPKDGWSKRSTGYLSPFTNWQQRDEGNNPNGGATSYGYFVLYGKVR